MIHKINKQLLGNIACSLLCAMLFLTGCVENPLELEVSNIYYSDSEHAIQFGKHSYPLVTIDGGIFVMGSEDSNANDDEAPVHQVALSKYYIGKTEVTWELWDAIMGTHLSYGNTEGLPITNVSYNDCQTFISRLNEVTGQQFRLPTEAEWEYAARGGKKTKNYTYSGNNTLNKVGWYKKSEVQPVGGLSPNELGIYDMSGNVAEWCRDTYDTYSWRAQTNPQCTTGKNHVLRGGSYESKNSNDCRVSARNNAKADAKSKSIGLRLVLPTKDAAPALTDKVSWNANTRTLTYGLKTYQFSTVGANIFTMGSVDTGVDPDESPLHQVALSSYHIGQTEVPQGLWDVVMGTTSDESKVYLPVVNKSYTACYNFIKRLNEQTGQQFRLPTEAEWEFAAMGGNPRETDKVSGKGWWKGTATQIMPVGTSTPNDLNLYDMSGNVWDLCHDFYGNYTWQSQTNPMGPESGLGNVIRGGYYAAEKDYCRITNRAYLESNTTDATVGFRLVLPTNSSAPELGNDELRIENGVIMWGTNRYDMKYVGGGVYVMGDDNIWSTDDPVGDSYPQHYVSLSDFYMGQTEVTYALWDVVMGTKSAYPNQPAIATYSSWQTFLSKLNTLVNADFRMPTEAEWEYAARGGNKTKGYTYSGSNTYADVAWVRQNANGVIHNVAEKSPNELGLYDMSGNAAELCSDYFGDYDWHSQINPTGPELGSSEYVVRGGKYSKDESWGSVVARDKVYSNDKSGLRLVLPTNTPAPTLEADIRSKYGDIIHFGANTYDLSTVSARAFVMGNDAHEIAYPMHNVSLSDYRIGKTEITNEFYYCVLDKKLPANLHPKAPKILTWNDTQMFIETLNEITGLMFRLPTEAEWEYAAQGGYSSKGYIYSGSDNLDDVAWYYGNSHTLQPVGQKQANELGLYDMSGNAAEWCIDYFGDYDWRSQTNPTGPETGTAHVIRGGHISTSTQDGYRVIHRESTTANKEGFRLVLQTGTYAPSMKKDIYYDSNNTTLYVGVLQYPFKLVDNGIFTMGENQEYSNAFPTHKVSISSYYTGKFEVTKDIWSRIMNDTPSGYNGHDRPIGNISWDETQDFFVKLNSLISSYRKFRLPTEAEWEFAARGGNDSKGYIYSGSNNLDDVAWYSSYRTYTVGTKSPNELGLYDMSGNVSEWCSDWYGKYSDDKQTNPQGPTEGTNRVIRGGSCSDYDCKVVERDYASPTNKNSATGFRMVLEYGYDDSPSFPTYYENGYEYVDLGLPSGVLWATRNLGSYSYNGSTGDYYAWGETSYKNSYSWHNYIWGEQYALTKYCTDPSYGSYGFTDNKTTLELEDDAANNYWNGGWRMPTKEEFEELAEYCTWTWTTIDGINGLKIHGPNGESIFLPATGMQYDTRPTGVGEYGYYWTSSLYNGEYFSSDNAHCFCISKSNYSVNAYVTSHHRDTGFTIRAVLDPKK